VLDAMFVTGSGKCITTSCFISTKGNQVINMAVISFMKDKSQPDSMQQKEN